MVLNYDLKARQKQIKDDTIKKMKRERSSYMSKLNQMNLEREIKQKGREMNRKLKTKDEIIILTLNQRNMIKNEHKRQMIELLMQKESNAKSNVEQYQREQEEYRRRESERTREKKRNAQRKYESKLLFERRLFLKEKNYKSNYSKLQMTLEENEKEIEKRRLKKYQSFVLNKLNIILQYWNRKEHEERNTKYKIKNLNKTQIIEERQEKIEKQNEKNKKYIMKKIKLMTDKTELLAKKKCIELEIEQIERRNKINMIQKNNSFINEKREQYNKNILNYQSEVLNRSSDKCIRTSMNRSNSLDYNLKEKMKYGVNEKRFIKKLEVIKSNSILKKTPNDKYKLYKNKKKKEYDERNRIEEEKKDLGFLDYNY